MTAFAYDDTLRHNIPNLVVSIGDATYEVNFLDFYESTGGLSRWGLPTSEVLEVRPDVLAQYFQRGVVEWKRSPVDQTARTFQRGAGLGLHWRWPGRRA